MEATITSIKNNPLLGRAKAQVELDHEGEATPSKEDVKSRLAAEQDFKADKLEVVSIYTGYGHQMSKAEIKISEEVDEEEYEDKLEEHTPETPDTDAEETTEVSGNDDANYDELVSGNIGEVKEELQNMDNPDYEAALEAEKDNKNRKTLVEWLEGQ